VILGILGPTCARGFNTSEIHCTSYTFREKDVFEVCRYHASSPKATHTRHAAHESSVYENLRIGQVLYMSKAEKCPDFRSKEGSECIQTASIVFRQHGMTDLPHPQHAP